VKRKPTGVFIINENFTGGSQGRAKRGEGDKDSHPSANVNWESNPCRFLNAPLGHVIELGPLGGGKKKKGEKKKALKLWGSDNKIGVFSLPGKLLMGD